MTQQDPPQPAPDPGVERAVAAGYVPVMINIDRDGRTADRFGELGLRGL